MVAEVYAGLSAFKAMFDMAKGLKDINDAAIRNGAVIELQEQILTAQQQQAALIERIGDLEKEIATYDKWDSEKEKYELKPVSISGMLAYMLKKETRGSEPPHWLCTNCYENRKRSILQFYGTRGRENHYKCHCCGAECQTHGESPTWF